MEAQRERARASSQFAAVGDKFKLDVYPATEFVGYESAELESSVVAILQNDVPVDQLENGDQAVVILEKTPFYAEAGGQVGDIGCIAIGDETLFRVCDTQKQNDVYLHIGQLETGELGVGDKVESRIDESYRRAVMLNHSATHLMHDALRKVLGELFQGYEGAAEAIDRAGGALDGIGLGEWVHGGDIREALDQPHPYFSPGAHLATDLLFERSRSQATATVDVHLESGHAIFGPSSDPTGELFTDTETFVRLTGGRRPDPARYSLSGADPTDLVLFS